MAGCYHALWARLTCRKLSDLTVLLCPPGHLLFGEALSVCLLCAGCVTQSTPSHFLKLCGTALLIAPLHLPMDDSLSPVRLAFSFPLLFPHFPDRSFPHFLCTSFPVSIPQLWSPALLFLLLSLAFYLFACPGVSWDSVNFLLSSWYSAVFWI